jgi:hypothetical protein
VGAPESWSHPLSASSTSSGLVSCRNSVSAAGSHHPLHTAPAVSCHPHCSRRPSASDSGPCWHGGRSTGKVGNLLGSAGPGPWLLCTLWLSTAPTGPIHHTNSLRLCQLCSAGNCTKLMASSGSQHGFLTAGQLQHTKGSRWAGAGLLPFSQGQSTPRCPAPPSHRHGLLSPPRGRTSPFLLSVGTADQSAVQGPTVEGGY